MESKLKVELLSATLEGAKLAALAAKLCYSPSDIATLAAGVNDEITMKMINKIMSVGHTSILEHITLTFGVEGISRALSHQLVRHRLASYSQQSQRYVKETQFDYVIPKTVKALGDSEIKQFEAKMELMQGWYSDLIAKGIPAEDARFYLPNAAETKIIFTMNARELIHFFSKRLCKRAQWEIRDMAEEAYKLAKNQLPLIFEGTGPHCVNDGYCPEGAMSCGCIIAMYKKYAKPVDYPKVCVDTIWKNNKTGNVYKVIAVNRNETNTRNQETIVMYSPVGSTTLADIHPREIFEFASKFTLLEGEE